MTRVCISERSTHKSLEPYLVQPSPPHTNQWGLTDAHSHTQTHILHSLIHSLIYSGIHLLILSLIDSCIRPLIHPCIH